MSGRKKDEMDTSEQATQRGVELTPNRFPLKV